MDNVLKLLEIGTPGDRRAILNELNEMDLRELARYYRISVHGSSNPDKQTLINAIVGYLNC